MRRATSNLTRNMLHSVGSVASTSDPQVTALLENEFHRFDQWKSGREINRRSKLMRLRRTLDHLLTRLLGARDYAGAAQVLSVLYHRFTLLPSRCVQASLEILRRHPHTHKEELMQFYQVVLRNGRLDQVIVFKEMLMLHIVSGDYYEAYHLFKEEMQELDIHHDAHVQGTFGMVCYWLLFVESGELRQRFVDANPDSPLNDEVENDVWNPFTRPFRETHQNWYKTPIGVHILFQEAATALRRAITVSPESVIFLEFYVQLLTLTGDTDRACDLLEHFYFQHPTDPHAARLLVRYLEAHFPQSSESQVVIYARWLENDPSSSEALERLVQQSKNGLITRERLLSLLASALDVLGGDVHLSQSSEAVVRLWRSFAEVVQEAIYDEAKNSAAQSVLTNIRASRKWWIESYLSRPATPGQVMKFISRDEMLHELLVLKAIVGYHLFKENGLVIGRGLYNLGLTNPSALKSSCMKIFRRVFHTGVASNLFVLKAATVKSTPAPQLQVSILNRSFLIKDSTHATGPRFEVIRTEKDDEIVDQELVRVLEEALRVELADGHQYKRQGKRSFEIMASGGLMPHGENVVSVPLYVELIEELLYKRTKAWSPHIQEQLNGYLRDAGATIPSWLEVQETFRYFQERWISNEAHFDHPGLLHRYEAFLVRYMRTRAKSSQYWVAGITSTDVQDALHEMKLRVSRSHVHFPEFDEAAKWMRIKAPGFIRTRRRLLRDYMLAMRFVAYESGHVETRDLVYAAMRVAAQNHHSDLLRVEDLQRQAKTVLVNRYAFVVRHMKPSYREFFESYVRVGRTYDPVETFAAFKRRYIRMKRMKLNDVKAFLWLKQWEADHPGRYHELVEDRDDDDQ